MQRFIGALVCSEGEPPDELEIASVLAVVALILLAILGPDSLSALIRGV